MNNTFKYLAAAATLFSACGTGERSEEFVPVTEARDRVLERIYQQISPERFDSLDEKFIMDFITDDEKDVFANNHWVFTVDKPAIVSVMRHKGQKIVPFWLSENGFTNTGKTVTNQSYEYEVWQKRFPAGKVNLGINGFDLHREVYFVTIGPVEKGAAVGITDVYPDDWPVIEMGKGAYMYNDWSGLTVQETPEELDGHTLFTTVRGRARDASIVKSFRPTKYPSSTTPDQVVLTWKNDPATTRTVQWRTNTEVGDGYVIYRKHGSPESDVREAVATSTRLKDAYVSNDMNVNHWEVTLTELTPATRYDYKVVSKKHGTNSPTYSFVTAPTPDGKDCRVKFIYLGDTHNEDVVEPVLSRAFDECPDAAFVTVTGDNVGMGQFRDMWDRQFNSGREVFSRISYMPVLGNHDSQDGVPPVLYTQLFGLPEESGDGLIPERNYTFAYGGARFFSVDVTGGYWPHILTWLDRAMSSAPEKWKIVFMHFPPYHSERYSPRLREMCGPLFDKHDVALVLSGHIHEYFRSYPIFDGKAVADTPGKGTVYVASVTVKGEEQEASPAFNEVISGKGNLYQIIEINGDRLDFVTKTLAGEILDKFQISKPGN